MDEVPERRTSVRANSLFVDSLIDSSHIVDTLHVPRSVYQGLRDRHPSTTVQESTKKGSI
jgi:hypothetical protein